MRKLAAILLFTLLVFNVIGYWLCIEYALNKSDKDLEAKLDKGLYNTTELITLKIPLNLPYQTDRNDYERVNGEINVNGTIYKYVQRKVYNDTLTLQCILHTEKSKLQQKANDYFGKINDFTRNGNNKKAEVFKQLFSDYDLNTFAPTPISNERKGNYHLFDNTYLIHHVLPVHDRPPQLLL